MLEVFVNAGRFKLSRPLEPGDEYVYVTASSENPPVVPWGYVMRLVLEGGDGVEIISVNSADLMGDEYELYLHARGLEGTTVRSWAAGTVVGNRWTAAHATRAFGGALQTEVVDSDVEVVSGNYYVVTEPGVTLYFPLNPSDGEIIGFCNATQETVYVNWAGLLVKGVRVPTTAMGIPPGGAAVVRFIEGMWA